MQLLRKNDIIAIKDSSGRTVGFHSRNLEVAELTETLWQALQKKQFEDPSVEELNIWNNEENPDATTSQLQSKINNLTINVTQVCNLHCTYCAAGGDGTYGAPEKRIDVEKTIPQLKYFLDRLNPGSTFTIKFLGGEPLLYPQGIKAIAEYVADYAGSRQIQPQFSITTNATLVSPTNLELLKSLKCLVTVSLDGPPEINDINRKTASGHGSSRAALHGLELLVSHRSELGSLGVSAVFDHNNMHILESYEYFQKLNIDWMEFVFSHTELSSQLSEQYMHLMAQVAEKAYSLGGETELRRIKLFDHYFTMLDHQKRTENYCGAGKNFLMVDAKNNLFTCPWDVENKSEQVGSGDYIDTEKLAQYQNPLIEANNCQTCWAKYLCGGGCMYIHKQKTGDKHVVDKEFCERTRYLIATSILYYEKSRSNKEFQ